MKMRADHYGLISLGLDGLIRKHDIATIARVFRHNEESYGLVGARLNMYSAIRGFMDKGLSKQAEKEGVDSSVLIVDLHDSFQRADYTDANISTAVGKIIKDKNLW